MLQKDEQFILNIPIKKVEDFINKENQKKIRSLPDINHRKFSNTKGGATIRN